MIFGNLQIRDPFHPERNSVAVGMRSATQITLEGVHLHREAVAVVSGHTELSAER